MGASLTYVRFWDDFVPAPSLGAREQLYTQQGLFVQTILADRYFHRRELQVVSLKSRYILEYGIKKIFSIFVFYRELLKFKVLWIFYCFCSHFQ